MFGVCRALDKLRAQLAGLSQAHTGPDPAGTCLVRTGDNTGTLPAIGDSHRTSTPFGTVTLLDRGEEGIHVHQCNSAGPDCGPISGGFGMIYRMIFCGEEHGLVIIVYLYCNYIQYLWREACP